MSTLLPLLAIPILLGLVAFFFGRRWDFQGVGLIRAFGWIALCALPAVGWQVFEDASERGEFRIDSLMYLPLRWWVLLGGWTVQQSFEAVVGPRQVTMLGDLGFYLLLTIVQTLVLATPVAWRLNHGAKWFHPLLLGIGVLVLANALAGARWPWWGT